MWEGTLSGILTGLVEFYAAAYCLLLNANDFQIGLLASLPLLISSLAQLKAPSLLQRLGSRKKIFHLAILSQSFLSFAMAFAFLLEDKIGVTALIAGFSLFAITGQILHPSWLSWVGDILPATGRGTFFGERTRLNHIAIFFSALIGGGFLAWMKKRGQAPLGFCLVYIAGGIVRLFCLPLIKKIPEPALPPIEKGETPSLKRFIKTIFKTPFGLFVAYTCIINFAVLMNHPFVAPYMLEYLKLNYFTYGLLFATMVLAKFAFYPLWGRWADTYPAKKILLLSGIFFGISPLLWLFSDHLLFLLIVQAYRGAIWSGFEVISLKLLLDATQPSTRAHFVSYHSVCNGMMGVLGSMGGGVLILFTFLEPSYFQVFWVSALLQIATTLAFIPKFKMKV